MAVAAIGQVETFDADRESIAAYLERIDLFLAANAIPDDRKVPVFLTLVGGQTYALLRDLLSPVKPSVKTLAQLKETLKKHYEPKKIIMAERFRFHQRRQEPGETVAKFEAELRKLASRCEFGEGLEDALRDRLVCGLREEVHRKRLLAESELTLSKALTIAHSLELAEQNARELRGAVSSSAVHQVSHSRTPYKGPAQCHSSSKPQGHGKECYRCGSTDHLAATCRFIDTICHQCKKKGHLARVCRSAKSKGGHKGARPQGSRTQRLATVEVSEEADLPIMCLGSRRTDPMVVEVGVEGVPVSMEVDTGAAVSIMSLKQQQELFLDGQLQPAGIALHTYTAQRVEVVGSLPVHVVYKDQEKELSLVIVKSEGPALLGRDWLAHIRLDWALLAYQTRGNLPLEELLHKYEDVFREELGTVKSVQVNLKLKENSQPKFFRPRSVPFAIKDAIGKEIERLESSGVLEKVEFSKWATPIVPVPKKDGSFRLCGDYKVTLNPALEVDQHPLPKPEEIFASLAGGQSFSKLDLSQAYQQLPLDAASSELVTINTHLGLYRYTRLPFGVASAPAIFQRTMDAVLHGLPRVMCYLDDIILTGSTEAEHLATLATVLERLRSHGFRLKRQKCSFLQPSVEYLGHVVDAQGLHTTRGKQQAMADAPTPTNLTELRSFLGLVNYYGRFISNLATRLQPLTQLLHKGESWKWTVECETAFRDIKAVLSSSQVLAHYDPSLPLSLAADASPYGVGAVISQQYSDGSERPIAYASRTLTASEKNYPQIEKEALALVFGVKRFHQYLYGRKFCLITDHKPLTTILASDQAIPSLSAARLQRWAILLSAYRYDIRFRRTQDHANADGLSRLPVSVPPGEEFSSVAACFNLAQINSLPVTAGAVATATRQDPLLSKVLLYLRQGWPASVPAELQLFSSRRLELTVESQCLLWGIRVVVPQKLRASVLKELHSDHGGMVRMKSVARSYFWWPGLDKDVEGIVKSCQSCQAVKSAPSSAPLHPWVWPEHPWQRVHIDFAGPFKGRMFFLLIDAHSKWPEIHEMPSTTADRTIAVLRHIFAAYGLPQQVVSDNGPQFTSGEFMDFLQSNGVKHVRTAPYHPSSNGAVERLVQTFKQSMKAGEGDGRPLQHQLQSFLMSYRSTPHATTGVSPASLFLGRPIRTRFDLLRPNLGERVCVSQGKQKSHHDRKGTLREFAVGARVMVRDGRDAFRWVPGTILERRGPVSYVVELDSGVVGRKHVDHIRAWEEQDSDLPSATQTPTPEPIDVLPPVSLPEETVVAGTDSSVESVSPSQENPVSSSGLPPQPSAEDTRRPPQVRRSTRVRRPVDRFTF